MKNCPKTISQSGVGSTTCVTLAWISGWMFCVWLSTPTLYCPSPSLCEVACSMFSRGSLCFLISLNCPFQMFFLPSSCATFCMHTCFSFPSFFSLKVIKVLLQCPEYPSASLLISCFGYKHTFPFFHLCTFWVSAGFSATHSSRLCTWSNFFLSTAVNTWQVFNYTCSTFNVTDYLTDWNYIIVDSLYIYNNSTGGLLFYISPIWIYWGLKFRLHLQWLTGVLPLAPC